MSATRARAVTGRLFAAGSDKPALPCADPAATDAVPSTPSRLSTPSRPGAPGADRLKAIRPGRGGAHRNVTLPGPAPAPSASTQRGGTSSQGGKGNQGDPPALPAPPIATAGPGELTAACEQPIPADVLDRVRARLVADGGQISAAKVAAAVRAEGQLLGDAAILRACQVLRAQLSGAGPLEALLREPGVTDVLVNAPDEVWVDRGNGLEPAAVSFADEHAVRRLAQRLAAAAGRRVDDASPYVDACLPDGSRLHAVLYPLARRGTCLSLRVPRARGFTLSQLVELGTLTEVGAAWLCAIVAARLAFLVTGGAGTGKTTLLSTLLGLVDPSERLILIEDSAELSPAHAHLVRLESRAPNVEGVGQISVRDLVRQALRMRPDRLVVGEVRGPEVVDLLAALNTGHEGGCGTVHANAAADLPARMEALGLAAGLNQAALHSQLAAGVRVILHLTRSQAGPRRLTEICLLERGPAGLVVAAPAVSFGADGSAVAGPARAQLAELVDPRRGAR